MGEQEEAWRRKTGGQTGGQESGKGRSAHRARPWERGGKLERFKEIGVWGGRCGGAREELAPTQRPQKAPSAVWRVAWSFPAKCQLGVVWVEAESVGSRD